MIPYISSFLSRHLLDRVGGHRRKVLWAYAAKKSFDFLDPQTRRQYQADALASLLNHARLHVPRFRDLLGKQREKNWKRFTRSFFIEH
jgi:hypothetical protein